MGSQTETEKTSIFEPLVNGLVRENPTFVLMLGMCPTLAVTTSAINGLGMGLTTTVVLVLSNMIISMLRFIIPNRVRIPAFIVIIASFVTMVQLLLEGFIPSLYDALGLYIPLIVVNCIILGRAESFASKNGVLASCFDGLGMGLGFSVALTLIGMIREILGAGEVFGFPVINSILAAICGILGIEPVEYIPISIFVLAPGAFFVLAALTAIQNRVKRKMQEKNQNADKIQSGCSVDCMDGSGCAGCSEKGCERRFIDMDGEKGSVADVKAKADK